MCVILSTYVRAWELTAIIVDTSQSPVTHLSAGVTSSLERLDSGWVGGSVGI